MEITLDERKKLHQLCFLDTNAYVDFFFEHFFNEDNHLDIVKDNLLVATLYWKVYHLHVKNRIIPYHFVTGLCVHPNYRHQNLATELIQKLLETSSAPFVALHPFLVEFYQKQDFYPFSFAQNSVCQQSNPTVSAILETDPARIKKVIAAANLFAKKTDTDSAIIFKPEHQYDAAYLEFLAETDEGAVFETLNAFGKVIGYAIRKDKEIVQYMIDQRFHLNDVIGYLGVKYSQMKRGGAIFNQARITNVEDFLYCLPYKKEERCHIDFNLTDRRIARNNGCFRVVIYKNIAVGVLRMPKNSALPTLSIGDLGLILSGQIGKLSGDAKALEPYFYNFDVLDINQY